jgi:hypothetical protein
MTPKQMKETEELARLYYGELSPTMRRAVRQIEENLREGRYIVSRIDENTIHALVRRGIVIGNSYRMYLAPEFVPILDDEIYDEDDVWDGDY